MTRGATFTIEIEGTDKTCPVGECIGNENLIQFDALSLYKKYTHLFDIDSVPESERKEVARLVADKILSSLRKQKKPKKLPNE